MKVFFIACVMIIKLHAVDIYLDQFHALQNQLVVQAEFPVDVQESLSGALNIINSSRNNVFMTMHLWELSYRRYLQETTSSGLFYSYGLRSGQATLNDSSQKEVELAVMPFYDVGIKSKLNNRWSHIIKVEFGYFILYTTNINIDNILGLQITPFFSFGYNLD